MRDQVAVMREQWSNFAVRFTETANKRMTLQCAQHLHAHMQLEDAQNVLEVAAGAGLGSLDVVQYLLEGRSKLSKRTTRSFTVTDLSPVMVNLAKKNLSDVAKGRLHVQCQEANGQELVDIASGSMDRYIASLCLQLTPDPDALLREAKRVLTADGIAGFTIWGSPERSGIFVINTEATKKLGFEATEHPYFTLGKDLPALRKRFADAGFTKVQIWPFLCVVELWSGEEFAKFLHEMDPMDDKELHAKWFDIVKRMAAEWLAKGTPIGLETYIILAKA
ncbi:hypothetical protein PHYBOEH_008235 [Phytophthora boehmeriae]|uniref:Methyltransferase type 11 domain-containing protein n=1 Tax=Phytophthora boehmeriae TaxID=109152 RepID=A0A8T1W0W4_9STRA|nr:hypothetical protein PHYBOEH_008235 [Phytophthora boehmeriae]